MEHGAALAGQLAQQRQRNDALPAAGAAGDDHRRLGVAPPGPLDRVQDEVVGVALLVEEDEHLAVLDLLGGDGEQLLRRRDAAGEQVVGVRCAGLTRSEPGLEELQELAAALPGEDPAQVVPGMR